MKTIKAESQKKDAKKAAKKELEKNLSNKFFEAVKSLGHDAATIGEDLVLVSKFVAKKISKKVGSTKKDVTKKVAAVVDSEVPEKKALGEKVVTKAEKVVTKAEKVVTKAKKAQKEAEKAAVKGKQLADGVLLNEKAKSRKPVVKGIPVKVPSKKDNTVS
jgi:hypothetical protein